jgi:hypothetical protein
LSHSEEDFQRKAGSILRGFSLSLLVRPKECHNNSFKQVTFKTAPVESSVICFDRETYIEIKVKDKASGIKILILGTI